MICIYCGSNLEVTNSRPQTSRNQVWRRRKCRACAQTYTTTEHIELGPVLRVNTGSHSSAFDSDKLFISLYNACRHRPAAASDARGLAQTITSRLIKAAHEQQIAAEDIVAIAQPILKRFDTAAAVQYAAFHKPGKR